MQFAVLLRRTDRKAFVTEKLLSPSVHQAPTRGSPIGEFGGGPARMDESGLTRATPAYWLYETAHATLCPARAVADANRLFFQNPANPLAATPFGKSIAAACELFERSTRRYGRPNGPSLPRSPMADSSPCRSRPSGSDHSAGSCISSAPRGSVARCLATPPDRGSDVRPLPDAAARNGSSLPAQPRRLPHRVD